MRTVADDAGELIAINQAEQAVLYNPSPETDSLAEHLVSLRAYGVPEPVVRRLLDLTRQALRLNAAEGVGERELAGRLEALAATPADVLGVKNFARALRPHLTTLRQGFDLDAADAVHRLATAHPDLLARPSLAHELGKGAHEQLMHLTGGDGA